MIRRIRSIPTKDITRHSQSFPVSILKYSTRSSRLTNGQDTMEAGPSKGSAAEKWYNPLGPPVGSPLGARIIKEDDDVFSQNAWYV